MQPCLTEQVAMVVAEEVVVVVVAVAAMPYSSNRPQLCPMCSQVSLIALLATCQHQQSWKHTFALTNHLEMLALEG